MLLVRTASRETKMLEQTPHLHPTPPFSSAPCHPAIPPTSCPSSTWNRKPEMEAL
jgi:hypothetical protein